MTTNNELEKMLTDVVKYDVREYGKSAYKMREYVLHTHPHLTITTTDKDVSCVSIPSCTVFGIDLKITRLSDSLHVVIKDYYGTKSGDLLVSLGNDVE